MTNFDLRKFLAEGKLLKENKYDIDDPNSPLGQLNDNDQDVAILNNMTKKYGKDVVLMWMSSGEYGDREYFEEGKLLKEERMLNEDNLEVKSIAKQLYSFLKQNGVNTKLIAQVPSTSYGKQIGASLKGESDEALIAYYDDPKTKQTVIQVQLYGGPTSEDLVLQVEKKLLSTYPKLEQYDRQETPTPQFFNLNFKVKEK